MEKNVSRRIFIFLTASFFFLGPAFVLYAYGWRIDPTAFRPTRVGGILVRDLAPDARLTINGQPPARDPEKKLGGKLIKDLLPGNYELAVERTGYRSWKKTVTVEAATVAETRPLVFVPVQPAEKNIFKKPLLDFRISDGRIAYKEADGTVYLAELGDNARRKNLTLMFDTLKESQLKFPGHVPIAGLHGTDDGDVWLLETASASYRLDTKQLVLILNKEKPADGSLPRPAIELPDPESVLSISGYDDPDHVFVQYPGKLYLLEVDDRPPLNLVPVADRILKYQYEDGKLYLLRKEGLSYFEF